MDEECAIRPKNFSQVPSTVASDPGNAECIEPRYLSRSCDETETYSPFHRPSNSENTSHDPIHLDIQYIDLITRLQSLLRESTEWSALKAEKECEAVSLLQTILVDLRVWAYDLSDENASLLEYFGSLSKHSNELKTHLQRIFSDIDRLLTSIENEAEIDLEARPRSKSHESLLKQSQRMEGLIESLQSLKPSLRDDMTAWRKDNLSQIAGPSRSSPPVVLTFDGGGVKSYSSLLILRTLMKCICDELAKELGTPSEIISRKPCEIFDFIFGSSSGGLIAIMLGRLEMTVDECIEKFCAYADTIFTRSNRTTRLLRPFSAPKYSADGITQATRRLVGHFDPTPESEKWKRHMFATQHGRCKTGVLATSVSPKATPYMFRTYECEMPPASENLGWKPLNPGSASTRQIWEVARATSAAPTFFAPIHLDDNVFVDGGVIANNPTQEALREIAFLYGDLLGTSLVSIGSGISDDALLPASLFSGKGTHSPRLKNYIRLLRETTTQTELTNADVHLEASMNINFDYFRFNTSSERRIPLDDWDASGRTRTEIEVSTKNSLESEEMKTELHRCASAIAAKMAKGNQLHITNVHHLVPRTPNSLFTGRTEILHYIRGCLTSNDNDHVGLPRTFVITGMGGQGKSEICLKLAHDIREDFWGIFWVDVSTLALAESDFVAVAKALGVTVNNLQDALRVLGATKQRWLLILDNADDPEVDYQTYIPSGSNGTIIMTSRMKNCELYNTIGSVVVDSLAPQELTDLLLKTSRTQNIPSSTLSRQIEEVIGILGSHTLAIIQAGAFIAAGHCRLDQYADYFQRHRHKMLQYTPQQAKSRHGNINATFETATAVLNNIENEADALSLLDVLSMLHFSPVPIKLFEDAWRGLVRLQQPHTTEFSSNSTNLLQWYLSYFPDFLVRAQGSRLTKSKDWDPFRLSQTIHLLESLALVIRNDSELSMHPLVHAWAKDRQSSSQQDQSWMIAGFIIVLSNHGSSIWHTHQLKLQPHLLSFLDTDIATALTRGPEHAILEILFHCSSILLQMRDDHKLTELLDCIIHEVKGDPGSPSPDLLPFYRLSAKNLLNQGRYEEAEYLSRKVLAEREALGPGHLDTLISLDHLAVVLQNQGKCDEAEAMNRRALEGRKEALGSNHPDTLASLSNLASMLSDQGKLEEAASLGREVLEEQQRILGEEHPDTISAMDNLAKTYWNQGRWEEVEKLQVQVIEKRTAKLGSDHPDTLTSIANLADIHRNQDRGGEAEEPQV